MSAGLYLIERLLVLLRRYCWSRYGEMERRICNSSAVDWSSAANRILDHLASFAFLETVNQSMMVRMPQQLPVSSFAFDVEQINYRQHL